MGVNQNGLLLTCVQLLEDVHKRFYDAYDARLPEPESNPHKASLVDRVPPHEVPYDVRVTSIYQFYSASFLLKNFYSLVIDNHSSNTNRNTSRYTYSILKCDPTERGAFDVCLLIHDIEWL